MASRDSIIYNRLVANAAINRAAKGNIFPAWRDDYVPAICYDLDAEDTEEPYGGLGAIHYELVISVVGDSMAFAVETADLVIADLASADWTDGANVVLGCFFENSVKASVAASADAPIKRLAVVDCRFSIIIR